MLGPDGGHAGMECVRARLHAAGLRVTRQREVVYAALFACRSHPTAEELFRMVREQDGEVSLATIYNTLDALAAAGLSRRIPHASGSGPCRYDADISPHAHVTMPDGQAIDLPPDLSERVLAHLPPELVAEVEARTGCVVDRVQVQFVARG